jgi:hypothetical protein
MNPNSLSSSWQFVINVLYEYGRLLQKEPSISLPAKSEKSTADETANPKVRHVDYKAKITQNPN